MSDRRHVSFSSLVASLESGKLSVQKACQEIEACLLTNRDNHRGFFEQCFAHILKHIFGYDGSTWLDQAAQGMPESDVHALERLLSPSGALFKALLSADADGLINFIFPLERLPIRTQLLLRSAPGRAEMERWPQYKGRIVLDGQGNPHIHLSVLTYFLFWTAFYVLRGSHASHTAEATRPVRTLSLTPNFGSVKKKLRVSRAGNTVEGHPYLRLLRAYLEALLPRDGSEDPLPAHSSGDARKAPGASRQMSRQLSSLPGPAMQLHGRAAQGQLLLSTFMEFWLSDENCPLPSSGERSAPDTPKKAGDSWQEFNDSWNGLFGGPQTSLRAVAYEPPSEEVTEALIVLARYVTTSEHPGSKEHPFRPAQVLPWLPMPPAQPALTSWSSAASCAPATLGPAGGPPVQAVGKSLYRQLHRALSQWPERRALTPIVRLWCAYMAPWWPPYDTSADMKHPFLAAPSSAAQQQQQHQGQVQRPGSMRRQLSHMGELVHSALGDAHTSTQADAPAGRFSLELWRTHVLANLPMYSMLLPLYLTLARSRVSSRCEETLVDLRRVLAIFAAAPELCQLIKDVEADYERFLQHPGRRPKGPYAEVLPFLAEQAQDWESCATATSAGSSSPAGMPHLRMFSGDADGAAYKAREVLLAATGACSSSLLAQVKELALQVLPVALVAASAEPASAAEEALPALETHQALKMGNVLALGYSGPPMRRPVASNEVRWLARALVRASDAANAALGLDQPPAQAEQQRGDALQQAKAYLRRRGGVNLRNPWGVCLAELPTLCCAPLLLALLWLMWKFLALAWAVITLPLEDGGPPSGFSEGAQTHSNMQAFQEGHFSAALDPQQSSSAHL
ncbi:hypothetical protein CVIRNUC_001137 [Coccomyxa viridis]|uniref:Sphingomyelin phosphodiesterase 4 n=1 Tax=Coccomyxa viridis TaxID=1274662 RepID=A0AAV1HUJ3_9CHLO|nr:hypothetical protein CVIRNUC_001137 [Coccomyxa viridis]